MRLLLATATLLETLARWLACQRSAPSCGVSAGAGSTKGESVSADAAPPTAATAAGDGDSDDGGCAEAWVEEEERA